MLTHILSDKSVITFRHLSFKERAYHNIPSISGLQSSFYQSVVN